MLRRKTAQAYGVLATLFAKLGDEFMTCKVTVEPYLNGREQGFSIRGLFSEKQAVFSECRNSDQIVLYVDNWNNFRDGNIPSDKTYENHQYRFLPYNYEAVADKIITDVLRG